MRRLYVLTLALVCCSITIFSSTARAEQEVTWKLGLAKAIITPEAPMYLAGYGNRSAAAEGKLHDIWIKVMALEDAAGHRGVIITSDVCGFSKASYEAICADLKKRCGLGRDQILLNYSHTHTGPALRECLQDYCDWNAKERARIKEYSFWLEKTIVNKVVEAFEKMSPTKLFMTEGHCDFAVNRRENAEKDVPDKLKRGEKLKGPVDHSVPMLVARSPQGELLAFIFGYSCHTTTLARTTWSGDYAGFAQVSLEKNHPGVQAMFLQTCGADANPLPRRSVELCRSYGQRLSDGVEAVLDKPMRPISPKLRTAFEVINLEYEKVMTKKDLDAYAAEGNSYGRWARRMLARLAAGEKFEKSYPYCVQVWKLGDDRLWISLGGEVVVDYALKFKSMYGPDTIVNGFAHDLTSYIPSRRIWDEGGYEGGALGEYGLPAMRWKPDIEERITAAVERLVSKVRN